MDDPCDPWFVPEPHTLRTTIKDVYQRWLPPLMLITAVVWLGCVYFLKPARPPVGSYVACLGCLAVVVTIWPPELNWSKAAWLVVFFCLTGLEICTLYQERSENQEQQASARREEARAFNTIATGLSTSITNNQKAFEATLRRMEYLSQLSKENISEVTGGSSFPYITIMTAENNEVSLAGAVHGGYRVHNVTYSLTIGRPPYVPTDEQTNEIIKNGPSGTLVGDLSPAHIQPLRVVVHPLTDGGYYNINLSASNGDWNEKLAVRPMRHQPRWDWKVTLKRAKDDKVVYEQGWGENRGRFYAAARK
jgi:hypothetical protein